MGGGNETRLLSWSRDESSLATQRELHGAAGACGSIPFVSQDSDLNTELPDKMPSIHILKTPTVTWILVASNWFSGALWSSSSCLCAPPQLLPHTKGLSVLADSLTHSPQRLKLVYYVLFQFHGFNLHIYLLEHIGWKYNLFGVIGIAALFQLQKTVSVSLHSLQVHLFMSTSNQTVISYPHLITKHDS